MGAAQQSRGGEMGQTGPLRDVEAGARVDLIGVGAGMLPGERFDHLAAGRILLGLPQTVQ